MLQSFIVYGVFGFMLWVLGTVAAKRERIYQKYNLTTPFFNWEIILSLLIFAFFSGIRWDVGTDHLSYLLTYENFLSHEYILRRDDYELGFLNLTKWFARANIHFALYFAFWAFLQLFFVYYAFKNERYLLPYLGLIILFGGQYIMWMNGMRQTLAACIFVFSIQFITRRKLIYYLLCVLLAYLFHKSALLLLPIYFIPHKNFFANKCITVILIFMSIIIGMNSSWLVTTDKLGQIASFIGYDDYAYKLDLIYEMRQKDMNFGARRIINTIIALIIVWLFSNKSKEIILYYNLFIFGILYFNLFASTMSLFLRPIYYFLIFSPILVSYTLFELKNSNNRFRGVLYYLLFIISISNLLITIYSESVYNVNEHAVFRFFWDYTYF